MHNTKLWPEVKKILNQVSKNRNLELQIENNVTESFSRAKKLIEKMREASSTSFPKLREELKGILAKAKANIEQLQDTRIGLEKKDFENIGGFLSDEEINELEHKIEEFSSYTKSKQKRVDSFTKTLEELESFSKELIQGEVESEEKKDVFQLCDRRIRKILELDRQIWSILKEANMVLENMYNCSIHSLVPLKIERRQHLYEAKEIVKQLEEIKIVTEGDQKQLQEYEKTLKGKELELIHSKEKYYEKYSRILSGIIKDSKKILEESSDKTEEILLQRSIEYIRLAINHYIRNTRAIPKKRQDSINRMNSVIKAMQKMGDEKTYEEKRRIIIGSLLNEKEKIEKYTRKHTFFARRGLAKSALAKRYASVINNTVLKNDVDKYLSAFDRYQLERGRQKRRKSVASEIVK